MDLEILYSRMRDDLLFRLTTKIFYFQTNQSMQLPPEYRSGESTLLKAKPLLQTQLRYFLSTEKSSEDVKMNIFAVYLSHMQDDEPLNVPQVLAVQREVSTIKLLSIVFYFLRTVKMS